MIINSILIYKCVSLQYTMTNNPDITQVKRNKITQINTPSNKTIEITNVLDLKTQ